MVSAGGENGSSGAAAEPFSVIVPVYNEASGLAERSAGLLRGLPEEWEVLFVCNGCTDDSEAILRRTVGDEPRAAILMSDKGKANAIRMGEARAAHLRRFYVDSDVDISGADLALLGTRLGKGTLMVSPRIEFELEGGSWITQRLNRFWLDLPHGRAGAFHYVIGLSADARRRCGDFPDVVCDDLFIECMVEPHEKSIVAEVIARTRPPLRTWPWIRIKIRNERGHRQLQAMGLRVPIVPDQYREVIGALFTPRTAVSAVLYIAATTLARVLARTPLFRGDSWYQDETSRAPGEVNGQAASSQ